MIKLLYPLRRIGLVCLALAGVALASLGCSGKVVKEKDDPGRTRITQLGILYGRYSSQHYGRPPATEKDFKDWVHGLPADQLPPGVELGKTDEVFVSPRDNQPYVVRYGVAPGAPGPPSADGKPSSPVLAYEKVGSMGKHYVVYSTVQVEEVDDARLKEMVPDAH